MKSYPFLKKNLKALESQGSPICTWLAAQGIRKEALDKCIIRNRRGLLDWKMPEGQGLFDAISPEMAYRDWIPGAEEELSATLIIGTNLGYGLHRLLTHTTEKHPVMVLEPRPDILLACLGYTDYVPYLEKKRLHFIPPDRELLHLNVSRFILPCLFGKIFLRTDLPSRQLGPEYEQWSEQGKEALQYLRLELNTVRKSQDRMISNELGNLQRAMGEGSLTGLKGEGRGLTAVILGAGPSMDDFGPLLAEKPGRALYATAIQNLPALQRYGLKPHFCMAIDSNKSFMKVYDRLDPVWTRDIPLIYATGVHPDVVKAYAGPTLPLWTLGGLGSHVLAGRELVLDVGGNVGVALMRLMAWFGVDRVLLAGQDFSWTGANIHAEGHFMAKSAFQFNPDVHMALKNVEGKTIYTSQVYLTALKTLDRDISQLQTPVFNLYGGGMMIEGAAPVTWEKVSRDELLESPLKGPAPFLEKVKASPPSQPWPAGVLNAQWIKSLRSAMDQMKKIHRKKERKKGEIRSIMDHVLALIQQDLFLRPYLFNEIINLAGLLYTKGDVGIRDLGKSRQIVAKALSKINEIECGLGLRALKPQFRE